MASPVPFGLPYSQLHDQSEDEMQSDRSEDIMDDSRIYHWNICLILVLLISLCACETSIWPSVAGCPWINPALPQRSLQRIFKGTSSIQYSHHGNHHVNRKPTASLLPSWICGSHSDARSRMQSYNPNRPKGNRSFHVPTIFLTFEICSKVQQLTDATTFISSRSAGSLKPFRRCKQRRTSCLTHE
jgi:hypothetical protein